VNLLCSTCNTKPSVDRVSHSLCRLPWEAGANYVPNQELVGSGGGVNGVSWKSYCFLGGGSEEEEYKDCRQFS
jgi:hypothetical protein